MLAHSYFVFEVSSQTLYCEWKKNLGHHTYFDGKEFSGKNAKSQKPGNARVVTLSQDLCRFEGDKRKFILKKSSTYYICEFYKNKGGYTMSNGLFVLSDDWLQTFKIDRYTGKAIGEVDANRWSRDPDDDNKVRRLQTTIATEYLCSKKEQKF